MTKSPIPSRFAAALLLSVAACTGQIAAGGPGSGPNGGNAGNGSVGSNGGSGTGTAGTGSSGTGTAGTTAPPLGTDPGRVTVHRLNRAEYNNTVRDLLGATNHPADAFPQDDRGYGFDNIADVLTVSPVHAQLYQATAESLVTTALAGAQRAKILTCDLATAGETCARTVLRAFGRRAWRRPLTDAEVDHLMVPVTLARTNGDTFEVGVSLALQATIMSPNFLYRIELDPTPTSATPHALTNHELASRLSYFLWSTMPDDALFAAADGGKLTDPTQLRAQVTRMLADGKASALVDNFGGQWLYTRIVDEVQPDAKVFPGFDAPLRDAMKQETYLMLKDVLFGGLSAEKLLLSDYTYANDRLAKHYGLPALTGSAMQKVPLTDGTHRAGFLTHGSFLTVTSHPTSTSPVLRGKWILEQLMCQTISPPPNAAAAKLDMSTAGMQSLRQRLEKHHTNPCAVCHVVMDPMGFGLENYDPIGAYRTMDGTFPVDAAGKLPDGRTFNGAGELAGLVAKDPGFASCVTEKMYTYALGRGPETTPKHMDPALLYGYANAFRTGGYQFADLIAAIVTGDTFTKRRGEPPVVGGTP
jgi:Protein of unknown function (DUF1592)/Protein of unknown function (DUF1588)/Protein of unknown function (DUF1587)/Protein of unknown function (DUF1595)/Protein of unknown function (DUF1585)